MNYLFPAKTELFTTLFVVEGRAGEGRALFGRRFLGRGCVFCGRPLRRLFQRRFWKERGVLRKRRGARRLPPPLPAVPPPPPPKPRRARRLCGCARSAAWPISLSSRPPWPRKARAALPRTGLFVHQREERGGLTRAGLGRERLGLFGGKSGRALGAWV